MESDQLQDDVEAEDTSSSSESGSSQSSSSTSDTSTSSTTTGDGDDRDEDLQSEGKSSEVSQSNGESSRNVDSQSKGDCGDSSEDSESNGDRDRDMASAAILAKSDSDSEDSSISISSLSWMAGFINPLNLSSFRDKEEGMVDLAEDLDIEIDEVRLHQELERIGQQDKVLVSREQEKQHPIEKEYDAKDLERIQRIKDCINQYVLRPDYKPSTKRLTDTLENHHLCSTCNETFYLSSGLDEHLNRRIIKIIINSNGGDKQNIVSYNSCALMQYFATHGITDLSEEKLLHEISLSFNELSASDDDPCDPSNVSYEINELEFEYNGFAGSETHCVSQLENAGVNNENHNINSSVSGNAVGMSVNFSTHSESEESEFWCQICQIDFVNAQLFYCHLKKEEMGAHGTCTDVKPTQVIICDLDACSFPAMSLCASIFHKKLCHEKKRPFICMGCGLYKAEEQTDDWKFLLNHMKNSCFQFSKVVQYKCLVRPYPHHGCKFQCETISEIISHYGSSHVNILHSCTLCGETFTNKYLLLKHLNREHADGKRVYVDAVGNLLSKNQCECCLEVLETEDGSSFADCIQDHLLSNINEHCSASLVFKCFCCSALFKTCRALNVHKEEICEAKHKRTSETSGRSTHGSPISQKQGTEDDEEFNILDCYKNLDGNSAANHFSATIESPLFVNSHEFQQCQSKSTPEDIHSRRTAKTSSPGSPMFLSWHSLQSRKQEVEVPGSVEECQYCSEKINSKELRSHQINCRKNSKRRCGSCFKVCHGRDRFLVHAERHVREGLKICVFCRNNPLKQGEELETHLREIHWDKVETFPHDCPLCKIALIDRNDLELHFNEHHIPKDEPSPRVSRGRKSEESCSKYVCGQCDLRLLCEADLLIHIQSSHSDSESPADDSDEKKKEKLFECTVCGKDYKSAVVLRRHERRQHKNINSVDTVESVKGIISNSISKTKRQVTHHDRDDEKLNLASSAKKNKKDSMKNGNVKIKENPQVSNDVKIFKDNDDHPSSMEVDDREAEGDKNFVNPPQTNLARLPNGEFKCIKCQEIIPSADSFYRHVRTEHVWKKQELVQGTKQFDNYDLFYCFECGAQFMTKSSLSAHVQLTHMWTISRSNDVCGASLETYLDAIGYGDLKQPQKKNQCEVCFIICENSLEYGRHIRSHGLAFLRLTGLTQRKALESTLTVKSASGPQ